MNKIFKTMRNKNGIQIAVSELAKGSKKGMKLSILTALVSLSTAQALAQYLIDDEVAANSSSIGAPNNYSFFEGKSNLVNVVKSNEEKFGLIIGDTSKDNSIKGREIVIDGSKNHIDGKMMIVSANNSVSIGRENTVLSNNAIVHGNENIVAYQELEKAKVKKQELLELTENKALIEAKKQELNTLETHFNRVKEIGDNISERRNQLQHYIRDSWLDKPVSEIEQEYNAEKQTLENEITERLNKDQQFEALMSSLKGFNNGSSGELIAIGNQNKVEGTTNTVIGQRNEVKSSTVVALGSDIAVENSNFSSAIGSNNIVKNATMANVIGNGNTVKSGYTTVVGNGIEIGEGYENAIVLGNESKVKRAEGVRDITIKDNTYSFAGTNPVATMSVGDLGAERQIVNVAAGRISDTSTDAINGSQLYALVEEVKKRPSVADISSEVVNLIKTKLVAGNNINIEENQETNTFTINAVIPKQEEGKKDLVDTNTQNTLSTEGNSGISLVETKNENGTTNYKVAAKVGKGLAVDEDGNIISTAKETIDTNTQNTLSTEGNSGINLVETKNENGTTNYKVSAKVGKGLAVDEDGNIISTVKETVDTNTQNTLSTEGNSGINLVETKNENGTTNYKVSAKVGKGLAVDEDGNIISTVKETVDTNTQNTLSTEGNSGINLVETKNENGTTNYKVAAKLGEGLTFDENGNIASTVKGISLSTEKESGINLIETKNKNGTTNYKVTTKLGEGLFFDQDGNIASTIKATNINGGKGVTVNKVENDYTIEVAGITTKTDDGKVQKRRSLQDTVAIKGDGKNIHTSTNEAGELVVGLGNNIKVDSVEINGGAVLNQDGLDMKGNRITNIANGVKDTDAVNVRQLQEQGQQFNQKLAKVEDRINKNRKRSDAGIAGVTAIANLEQVTLTSSKSSLIVKNLF